MMTEPECQPSAERDDLPPVLETVVRRLQERFGDCLKSVVLYGSYARGDAHKGSDIDLVVIVPCLPHEWRDIFALEDEVAEIGKEVGFRLDIRLFEPEAVSYAVSWTTPLMLEIGDSHRVLFDPSAFMEAELARFRQIVQDRGMRKLAPGVWRVPSLAAQ